MDVAGQVELVIAQLEDDQAERIELIDIRGRSSIADYIVIASGRSARHVRALTEHLVQRLKAQHMPPLGVEGASEAEWVLVDTGDVIIHIMLPKIRDFYNIESLWRVSRAFKSDAGTG